MCRLLLYRWLGVAGPEEGQSVGCTLLPGYNIQVCDRDEDGITRKFAFKVRPLKACKKTACILSYH